MNIAIIGYGGMGRYHTGLIGASEAFTVSKVYDIDAERAKLARSDGFSVAASYSEILSDKAIDVVLIATPNDTHFDLAVEAVKNGKNVILEKPATIRSEEFSRLCKQFRHAGKLLTVHQNRRWDRDYLTVKQFFENIPAGKVYKIESSVTAANGIPGEWRKVKRQGGGMVLDWGVHLVDQLLLLSSQKVVSVYARCSRILGEEVDDGFTADLRFSDGLFCRVTVDTNSFIPKPRFELYAECGSGIVEDWDSPLKVVRATERYDKLLSAVKAGNGLTKTMAMRSQSSVEELCYPQVPEQGTAFYRNLRQALSGKEISAVSGESVLRTLQVLEAIFLSDEEGKVIETNI